MGILDYANGPRAQTLITFISCPPSDIHAKSHSVYLCSQLASGTKGLYKLLPAANRFLSTSEGTAAAAAPICPPGVHQNMPPAPTSSACFTRFQVPDRKRGERDTEARTNAAARSNKVQLPPKTAALPRCHDGQRHRRMIQISLKNA